MSENLTTLNIVSAGQPLTYRVPVYNIKALVIGNESGYTCTVTLVGGDVQKTLYPSTVDWYQVTDGFKGDVIVLPTPLLNNLSSFPATSIIIDAIHLNDPEEASMYPVSLNRNTNIGNSVSTSVTSTNAIDNENNPAGTSIIKSIVSGDGTNQAVSLTNDAVFTLGDAAHHGSISIDNGKITSDGSGDLTVGGTLSVTGASTVTGVFTATAAGGSTVSNAVQLNGGNNLPAGRLGIAADGDILDANAANDVYLKARGTGGGGVHMQVPGGTDIVTFDSFGLNMHGHKITLNVGGLKDINQGTVAANGTVNHGLSGTPAAVLLTTNNGTNSSTNGAYSYTTTQFSVFMANPMTTEWWCYR